jgi:hypothetical protein
MIDQPKDIWAVVSDDGRVADASSHNEADALDTAISYADDFDGIYRTRRYVDATWAIAWIKERHLAWCRAEANETSLGFDDWIDEQWFVTRLAGEGRTDA